MESELFEHDNFEFNPSHPSQTPPDSSDSEDVDDSRHPEDPKARAVLKAAEKGNLQALKELIDAGGDPDLVNATDAENYTPLHRACYNNHVDTVKYLLSNGADLNAKTSSDWQPLHSCCRWGNVDCAAVLIGEGADVNAQTSGGQTPLHIAASFGKCYDMVQMLLMHSKIDAGIKNGTGECAFDIAKRSSKYYGMFDMADPLFALK